jgi:serine/threonine protein kinase
MKLLRSSLQFSAMPIACAVDRPGSCTAVITRLYRIDTMHSLIFRREFMPEGYIAYTAWRLFTDLVVLHSAGWMHNDIKPENILLEPGHEKFAAPYLCDYELACPIADARSREPLGTRPYRAPEKWDLSLELNEKADIWSVGVVLYQMASGVCPFQATRTRPPLDQQIMQRAWDLDCLKDRSQLFRAYLCRIMTTYPGARPRADELLDDEFIKWGQRKTQNWALLGPPPLDETMAQGGQAT